MLKYILSNKLIYQSTLRRNKFLLFKLWKVETLMQPVMHLSWSWKLKISWIIYLKSSSLCINSRLYLSSLMAGQITVEARYLLFIFIIQNLRFLDVWIFQSNSIYSVNRWIFFSLLTFLFYIIIRLF